MKDALFIGGIVVGLPVSSMLLTGDTKGASAYVGLVMVWGMYFGIVLLLGALTDAAKDSGREEGRREATAQKALDNHDYLG